MTPVARQFVRFVVVGASNTLLSVAAYVALLAVGVPYLLAAAVGFAAGATKRYLLNRWWTFSAPRAPTPHGAPYLTGEPARLPIPVRGVRLLPGHPPTP